MYTTTSPPGRGSLASVMGSAPLSVFAVGIVSPPFLAVIRPGPLEALRRPRRTVSRPPLTL